MKQLKIVLLGSFYPGERILQKAYDNGEPNYRDKLKKKKRLFPLEKLKLLEEEIKKLKHNVIIFTESFGGNILIKELPKLLEADLILLLFSNEGGIVAEHMLCLKDPLKNKTIHLVDNRDIEKISKIYTEGTFCFPNINIKNYNSENKLLKLVLAIVDSHSLIDELAELIK